MIWLIQPLSIGNALRILISPPNSAARWKLLRRDVEDFSGEADPLALVVHEGTDKAVTDFRGLLNGEQVFYKLYLLINGVWEDGGAIATAVPGATVADLGPDVLGCSAIASRRASRSTSIAATFVTTGNSFPS
jgi:hypothetical protein